MTLGSMACTSTTETANNTPIASPSPSPSPSASPSATPTPSSSPSSAPTPASSLAVSLPVHNGEVGVGYLAVAFGASGGTEPYTWSVGSGSLPPGLTVASDGTLSGTTTTAGQYSFSAKVTDSAGATGTGSTSISVFPRLAANALCVQQCVVGYACKACGRFGTQSGGAGPYTYKVVGGAIPPGMSLSGLALAGPFPAPAFINQPVDVIGLPRSTALWQLSVEVIDGFGVTATVGANFIEFGPLGMSCSNGQACASCFSVTCSAQVDYSGGNPSDLISVRVVQVCDFSGNCLSNAADIANALPPAFSATAKGGTVTVSYDCSTDCPNGYSRNVVIQLVDHGACVAPQYVASVNTAIINIDFNPIIG
jgi:hypothetical protein